jgi:signal transduction histidine kinase
MVQDLMTCHPLQFAERRILLEQLRLVMGNFRSTLPVLLLAPLLAWSLSNPGNTTPMVWWCAAVMLSNLNLQVFVRHQLATKMQLNRAHYIAWALIALHMIDGMLWGLLPWLTLDTANPSEFILVVVAAAGMMAAGLATQSPVLALFLAFAMPQAISLGTKLWLLEDPSYTIIVWGIAAYLLSLIGQSRNSACAARAAIDIRFELADSHAQLRAIEHRQTLEQERQRLMQDMHDGLGSSLISALRIVERGKLEDIEVAQVLKECIDDLKLAIDSMEPVDNDLLLLLATLRFRLEPRLENTGIALRWRVENTPALDWLNPGNALHILRIIQEAFTNIIKHAEASEVIVATRMDGNFILVTITDNGQGFTVADGLQHGGKGMSGQMRRAHAIGSEINWVSTHTGTCVTLRLPILQTMSD